jgi:OHCU decarboxylase
MTSGRLSIAGVNAMDRRTFVDHLGGIYEQSPWVAEQAWSARPFADRKSLEKAMQHAVLSAGRARQLELLRRHPALGTRLKMSGYSRQEQAGAGLAEAGAAEREELERLNREYERKFGFPFIYAVRNATLSQILESCRTRISADADAEFDESLRQVFKIAGFRLADLV